MKKRVLALFLVGMMALSLGACGSSETTTTSEATSSSTTESTTTASSAEEEVECTTIKFNFSKSSTDVTYGWWSDVFDEIYEKSGHTVKFEIYPSEALGTVGDTIEMAANGQVVMTDADLAYMATYVPDFGVGMAPYLMQKPEDIQAFWECEIGQDLCEQIEGYGLKIVSMSYFGTRQLMLNQAIDSRDDLSALKIRCGAAPMWNEVVRVLGGNATNTAWSEAYQAISQGVADGCESPLSALYSAKIQETCKYVINTDHCIASTILVMSNDVFNNLPQQAQDAITEVMYDYCDTAIENVYAADEEYAQKLADEGVTFIDVDKTDFIAAAQQTPEYFPEWTPGLYEDIQEMLGY